MKRGCLFLMAFLLTACSPAAKGFEVTKKAGEYTVVVKIDRNPPIVGDNKISIAIKDAGGVEVKDASVSVEYKMPAMSGMPAMNYNADGQLQGSEYRANLNFSMSGAWDTTVKISRGNKKDQARFSIDVR
jgi:hypothetical protein